jgi:undecaprenyl phosphate-alpha-L-ara4N flippase subunit ArnE
MNTYFLIALALLFTTSGQLLQKLATSRVHIADGRPGFLAQIIRFKETYWAVACLGLGMLIWLVVLYHMEVSKATPFLSLGFILVTLVSRHHLGEHIPYSRWFGVLLITLGLWMVSLS